jgi:hypothetical protein
MLTQVKEIQQKLAPIRPYSKSELCVLYDVSERVLNAWLNDVENLGAYKGRLFTLRQMYLIFDHLGWPEERF